MPTAYTSLLGLALPVTGELQGTWGTTVNDAITSLLDTAVAGTTTLSTDADVTLTTTTGASNQARQAIILWTANGTVTRNITAPAQSKTYVVINNSAGTQSIVIRGAGPTTGVTVLKGERVTVAWNGSDFVKVGGFGGSGTFNDVTITTGNLSFSGTAQRITGDFSNATVANRVAFQSSTANGNTALVTIPNGTASFSGWQFFNSTTPDNSAYLQVGASSTAASIVSGAFGIGTPLPMTFFTGGSERMRIDTSGNVSIGSTGANGNLFISGANSRVRFSNTAGTASTLLFAQDSGAVGIGTETNSFLYLTTNNTERMRIDTSGNVGVGTASPGYRLDVQAATASTLLKSTTGTNYAAHFLNNTGGFTYLGIESSTGGSLFSGTAAYSAVFGTVSAYPVALATNNTERLRIDSSGNVGIGISPFDKLDVNGGATVRGNLSVYSTTISQAFAGNVYGGMAVNNGTVEVAIATNTNLAELRTITNHPLALYTNNLERMRIDASGNVGIGGSPSYKFQVNGGSTAQWFLERSTGTTVTPPSSYSAAIDGFLCQVVADTTPFERFTDLVAGVGGAGSVMRMFTGQGGGPVERMRINSLGNVGIGTTSPSVRLQATNTSGEVFRLTNTTATERLHFYTRNAAGTSRVESQNSDLQLFAADPNLVTFGTSNVERMRIDTSGNVGIGTSSPNTLLHLYAATNPVLRLAGGADAGLYIDYVASFGGNITVKSNQPLVFKTNDAERARITATGNIVAGASAALATTATDGFLYVPTCAGTPTGTPTAITGMAPIVVNTTNNKLYFYSGGAWRDAGP